MGYSVSFDISIESFKALSHQTTVHWGGRSRLFGCPLIHCCIAWNALEQGGSTRGNYSSLFVPPLPYGQSTTRNQTTMPSPVTHIDCRCIFFAATYSSSTLCSHSIGATQVTLNASQLDVGGKVAVWGYDDVWRIVWMTLIFGFLMPLSRSAWALRKNFSLAMWLHIVSQS